MRSTVLVASLLVLAGCQTNPPAAATFKLPPLEELDQRMVSPPCGHGDAKVGDDLFVAGARKDQVIDCWELYHQAWVRFYLGLYRQAEELRAAEARRT